MGRGAGQSDVELACVKGQTEVVRGDHWEEATLAEEAGMGRGTIGCVKNQPNLTLSSILRLPSHHPSHAHTHLLPLHIIHILIIIHILHIPLPHPSPKVKLLLSSGADPSQRDNLGFSPLAEACKLGHDELIDVLVRAGATLADPSCHVEDAKRLCTAVFEGNLPQLRRLLRCGLRIDAGDYDKRTVRGWAEGVHRYRRQVERK